MSGKHPKTDTPTDADLKGNPGIGTSKGMSGADPADLQADSTFEGDVDNETKRDGGVDPDHRRARTPDRAGVTARPGRPGPGDPGQRARAGGFGRWGAGPVANPADGPLAGT